MYVQAHGHNHKPERLCVCMHGGTQDRSEQQRKNGGVGGWDNEEWGGEVHKFVVEVV